MNLYGTIIRTIDGKLENWHEQLLKIWAEMIHIIDYIVFACQ